MTTKERRKLRITTMNNLKTKYKLLFLNSLNIKGLDYEVDDYFMKKLLYLGKVAAYNLVELNELAFGTYSAHNYDWKGRPLQVKIIPEWQHALIPKDFLNVDEEAVLLDLGFVPMKFIDEYVARVIDIQATIDTNLTTLKMPFIIKSTDKKTITAIEKLLDNEEVVFSNDLQLEVLETKAEYLIDKLQLYKSETEAELLTILGINNIKFEKKAQMTKDEVNSNDEEIDAYRMTIEHRINQFFEQVNTVLEHNVYIEKEEIEEDDPYEEEGDDIE